MVAEGATVDTIAVSAVLVMYKWPNGSDRHRKAERFVQNLSSTFSKLQAAPFHPKWRDVNLSAAVPGWHRLGRGRADAAARASAGVPNEQQLSSDFHAFLAGETAYNTPRSSTEYDALFRKFLQWHEQQQGRAGR